MLGSAVLVTGTIISSSEKPGGVLSGYFYSKNTGTPKPSAPSIRESLSGLPLAQASTPVDPSALLEESEETKRLPAIASADLSPLIQKDPEEEGGVSIYTIQDGDTLSSVAEKHRITVNTILWANDLQNVDEIRPGDQIFILPVAGLKHIVSEKDTLEDIAKKYHGDKDRIIAFNNLPADGRIEPGEELIIPDGYKEEAPKPAPVFERREYATSSGGSATDISGWRTPEGKAGSGHRFPFGYCTWYVSQKRYVPWGGNAGTWLYNAKALGYKTGKAPRVGSIVVTTENRYYGHVALVEKVSGDEITVSEMNYVGWGKTNRRTLPTTSRSIKGYIY
ncbi:MAG: LysM peptidoglycan-binding domain-containing protein [Candidatus Moraniibacteriota bacterium]|nr:MAG: LysM peptidoglycan-binding domain-containing protein [Candidatus Moranbacteria bacterium]